MNYSSQYPTTNIISKNYHRCLENFKYTYSGHFFDKDTMRFFNSKVYEGFYYDRFIITSEKQSHAHDRKYSIRIICPTGTIDTIGEFQGFSSKRQAENFINKHLSKEIANVINLVRFGVNSGKYKRNIQSYINKNQKAFKAVVNNNIMRDRFSRYLNEYSTNQKGV